MTIELNSLITEALDDLKAQDIVTLDVKALSDVTDTLVIASGTSSRHVKSLANNVIEEAKKQNFRPIGMEGIDAGDWALVDFGEIVVHVMLPQSRKFYDLEKLWAPLDTLDSSQKTDTTL
ncbi:MAG: ribosome silencing factor [Cellvibrionaceae bacterium]